MIDDDFCDDADEWKQIADSYASELEHRDDRIDELQERIEQLEAIMQKLVEPFKKAAPLFGAQYIRSIKVGDQVIEELLAALEGKKDD